jgi:nucleoside-diphosphate-sugar epimerase
MRVVLTGSRGFIGSRLLRRLWEEGVDVLGVGWREGPARGPWGSRYHRCDRADPGSFLPPDLAGEPFTLVHLAWDTSRPAACGPHAEQVGWLAQWCDFWAGRGLGAVVMPGTAEEYGQRGGVVREDDPPEGRLSAYAWGKAAARTLLQGVAAGGLPVVWLRPFLVYGPGQTGPMAVPYAVRQALAGQPADFSDGLQRRDFVYVDDVVEAFVAAVRRPAAGFRVLNLGTGQAVAVREVLAWLGELCGAGPRFRFGVLPRRDGEPDLQVADTTRAEQVLGWRATVGWREGVRRLVEALRGPCAWTA